MTTVSTDYLALTWTTSRGQDTYGYNIARLDSHSTGKRFKCMGGGYDMIGTVVGKWLQDAYADRLLALRDTYATEEAGYQVAGYRKVPGLYGLTYSPKGVPQLDGACGISSMERIAEAIGLSLSRTYNRKGHTTGYMVTDYGSGEALRLARK